MVVLLTILHVFVCLFLVIVVLLQSGKAADLAGAFGGMGSQTAFGARGSATVLSKATTVAAGLFMVTSMTLAIMATRGAGSGGSTVLESAAPVEQSAPATGTPAPSSGAAPATVGEPAEGDVEGPSVTLTDPETGESKTMPLNISPPSEAGNEQQEPNN